MNSGLHPVIYFFFILLTWIPASGGLRQALLEGTCGSGVTGAKRAALKISPTRKTGPRRLEPGKEINFLSNREEAPTRSSTPFSVTREAEKVVLCLHPALPSSDALSAPQ